MKNVIFLILFIIASVFGIYFAPEEVVALNPMKEKDYVNNFCKGEIEYVLPDKTRVDCLTDDYAIEFDWASKWAESIGQSLYYAKQTGKQPAVALILKSPEDEKYVKRVEAVDKNIKIFKIQGYQ